jgi:putative peptidoglycan lipid II flippase
MVVAPLTRNKFFAVTSIVTAISLVGSFINFVSQAVLAFRFGASSAVDTYTYALSLPIFVSGLIGIIISYTAIPIMSKTRPANELTPQFGQILSFFMLWLVGAFLVLGTAAVWFQPHVLPPAASILKSKDLKMLILLAWVVGAGQILLALATAQLNASRRPIMAALLGLPTSCMTIVALFSIYHLGIAAALGGMAFGAFVSAALGFGLASSSLLPPRQPKGMTSIVLKGHLASALWASIALSCFASYLVVDAIWASRVGEGALASMGYAHRIIIGLGSLVVAGPSALFVPRFAALVETGQGAQFRRLLFAALSFTAAFGGLLAIGMYAFADLIVQLLFERGAFGGSASAVVADVLRHMAPGMLALLFSVITLRALFCLPASERAAAAMGMCFTCSYAMLSYMLLGNGIVGIAMAYSISWISFFAMLFSYVIWRSGQLAK